MAIEIKQGLRMAQQLVVTPQLQQAIKLLQMTQMELAEIVQKELIENPLLEESGEEAEEEGGDEKSAGEKHEEAVAEDKGHENVSEEIGTSEGLTKEPSNFDWDNYINLYNSAEIREERETPDDRPSYENFVTKSEDLHEHLLWQLQLNNFPDEEKSVGSEIIGNINDDGYLTVTTEDIAQKIQKEIGLVEKVLSKIQDFDPAGVGARTLEECLLLQVRNFEHDKNILEALIKDHLKDLERKDFEYIAKKLSISLEKVSELAHTISLLEPKPGRPYSIETPRYITPDVYVFKAGDDFIVTLNDEGMPKIRVSNFYRQAMMKKSGIESQTRDYIQNKMRSAIWLIKSIHQRQITLRKVSTSIVKFQKNFFEEGVGALKPLVLREVADDIGMHESTISRVTTNKYMHTPHGIFELKFFFNSGIGTSTGDGISTSIVHSMIKELIDKEDPASPHSDSFIADFLTNKKINIARRTVAKYRESLGIPSSSERRRKKH